MPANVFTVSRIDFALYALSVLVGISIVCINNMPEPTQSPMMLESYMEKVLTRMGSVSAHLARWESLDVRQYR